MERLFPLIFVLLWSSAFISSKFIVLEATPFAALVFRFVLVAGGFALVCLWQHERLAAPLRDVSAAALSGVLFHGLYLGGVFYAVTAGFPTGLTALLVSLQPILTGALAGPLLGEQVTFQRWVGLVLGFAGAGLVLGLDLGGSLPLVGFAASLIALLGVTGATLWQKKQGGSLPLPVSNFWQAASACLFHLLVMLALEPEPFINFTARFVWAMGWQIIAVSFGAFTILLYLIKKGSASQTASLFFLVPPCSALIAWLMLDEQLTRVDIVGFLLASAGVYIATRKPVAG